MASQNPFYARPTEAEWKANRLKGTAGAMALTVVVSLALHWVARAVIGFIAEATEHGNPLQTWSPERLAALNQMVPWLSLGLPVVIALIVSTFTAARAWSSLTPATSYAPGIRWGDAVGKPVVIGTFLYLGLFATFGGQYLTWV